MPLIPKHRRKKRRYKTGTHKSPKCATPIKYRSGWEKEVCIFLDAESSVKEYGYECLVIPYVANVRTGEIRSYYPDFLITYVDGTRKLVEVKRTDKLNNPKVIKKAKAAKIWAQANQAEYEFWTNPVIITIKKINQARKPAPKKPKARKARKPILKPKAKRAPKKATRKPKKTS